MTKSDGLEKDNVFCSEKPSWGNWMNTDTPNSRHTQPCCTLCLQVGKSCWDQYISTPCTLKVGWSSHSRTQWWKCGSPEQPSLPGTFQATKMGWSSCYLSQFGFEQLVEKKQESIHFILAWLVKFTFITLAPKLNSPIIARDSYQHN